MGENQYTIRAAKSADAPAVAAMWGEMARQHQEYDRQFWCWSKDAVAHWQKWFKELLRNPEMLILVAALPDEDLIGFVISSCKNNPAIFEVKRTSEVWDLFVRPEYRGKGIARGLMDMAFEGLQKMGAQDVRLHVAMANESAIALYEKMGMRKMMYRMYKRFDERKS